MAHTTTTDVAAIARHLYETQGASAIAHAAVKADSYADDGDAEQADLWRRVETTLREMRGARQT
jgi:hypothetical protein